MFQPVPGESVTVLIPAFNEEAVIRDTVRASLNIPGVTQVLVVNDGSGDNTARAALSCGAEVVTLNRNSGKGTALNSAAGSIKGDLVILLDADLGESASQAENLLWPVLSGMADMTVAVLPKAVKKAGIGLVRGLAGIGIRHFTGLRLEAPLSGQRAMRREVFLSCTPLAGGFGVEVHLTVRAGLNGYRILEVPVHMSHRESGRNLKGFMHRGRQFCHVARALFAALKMPP